MAISPYWCCCGNSPVCCPPRLFVTFTGLPAGGQCFACDTQGDGTRPTSELRLTGNAVDGSFVLTNAGDCIGYNDLPGCNPLIATSGFTCDSTPMDGATLEIGIIAGDVDGTLLLRIVSHFGLTPDAGPNYAEFGNQYVMFQGTFAFVECWTGTITVNSDIDENDCEDGIPYLAGGSATIRVATDADVTSYNDPGSCGQDDADDSEANPLP